MKQNNLAKLLGIALVVAIIATGVFYGLFVNKLSSSTGSGKMVVVAAKPLPAGTVLAEKDLQSIPWPVEQTPAGTFESTEQAAGRTVLVPLAKGEPVLAARLASSEKAAADRACPRECARSRCMCPIPTACWRNWPPDKRWTCRW